MKHDRTGERVDDAPAPKVPHHPDCRSGWLGEDLDGRPVPCLQCRPHLARTADINDCSKR
ncbi:hypothetical protein C8E05_3819 [Rhodococcus wratislaviensis]|uniref:Phage protein n=1 Tax=Rhodococcus wratislaviensis TaxID=44752 RepID=A0AB38FKM3_RHOWR|nr:hypothetical protein [Rhodococcus wratislaviensis]REE74384.1 hypothetical protein C8E05_3819 [Rhodococcus wratislaviensis]SPZ42079.1 Uncharacterised protein [Rhodococcus wratislaviensis]